ncbi:MAG: YbaK/EbsC family protein [Chlamydiales bacterium]|nr:YbaK/EbsC family protein [Chlamydiia bacterium]MCP5508066.1 YbaK/EbsC family protein [Chlamydiales bacterium]
MAASKRLITFLDENNVKYEVLQHPEAYTAQEIAGEQHVPGKQVVKSVIVNIDGDPVMCVLPSIHMIDFDSLKNLTDGEDIQLASEDELAEIFPEYEVGAEPPFGHLYGLEVYVDKFLENDKEIVFNAGSHTDMIKMSYKDYLRLTNPTVAEFGTHI